MSPIQKLGAKQDNCVAEQVMIMQETVRSFRRSALKVKGADVFIKKGKKCQLCCCVQKKESTPPLTKMPRLHRAESQDLAFRVVANLKAHAFLGRCPSTACVFSDPFT